MLTTVTDMVSLGSMGELTPVIEIDGRAIGYLYTEKDAFEAVRIARAAGQIDKSSPWPFTSLLQHMYRELTDTQGLPIP